MKLTDKCKEDFEKWYADTYYHKQRKTIQNLQRLVFDSLPDNQKYGVYVDFFDSVDIIIDIHPIFNYDMEKYTKISSFIVWVRLLNTIETDEEPPETDTRPEAREQAIKKANEIKNKQL